MFMAARSAALGVMLLLRRGTAAVAYTACAAAELGSNSGSCVC